MKIFNKSYCKINFHESKVKCIVKHANNTIRTPKLLRPALA